MSNKFSEALEVILHHEGGYVNHPKDPGGETNLGVTKRVYEAWVMENDLHQKDMKDLKVDDLKILLSGLKLVSDYLDKTILKPNNISYPSCRLLFVNSFK